MTQPSASPKTRVDKLRERFYPPGRDLVPYDHLLAQVDKHLTPESTVLDIGAGAGERNAYSIKGRCAKMVGVDFDARVTENPLLDEGIVMPDNHLPVPDATFDLAFSVYVLEHVDDADLFASEVARVLKPGGRFISMTPNRWHYVCLVSALTPHRFHEWVNRGRGRDDDDTFPTCYRLNTAGAQKKRFGKAGLVAEEIAMIECEPKYLQFAAPAYLCGVAYERLVNTTKLFNSLRVNIVSTFRKPQA